jgi:hypothetical protein
MDPAARFVGMQLTPQQFADGCLGEIKRLRTELDKRDREIEQLRAEYDRLLKVLQLI